MARLDELVANHKYCRDPETLHDTEGLGDDWIQVARQQQAGEVAHMFLDTYLPFAENGSGDLLYVDTRGGRQQGFVREFGWEVADDCDPVSASLTDYVDSVRISIESGTEHSGLLPTFEEGALIWDVDYSDSPPPVPPPKPTVIRIPFALTSFLPSQIGPEDDLIDLDVVRQAIIDTA
ncbi:SMI1/KNR4 family protein [Rhodococcus globerulus]